MGIKAHLWVWLFWVAAHIAQSSEIPPPWVADPDEWLDSLGRASTADPLTDALVNREDLNGGTLTTTVGTGNDAARAAVIQSDGRIVLGGRTSNGALNDFAIIRFFPDGSVDTAFGTNGRSIITFGTGSGSDEIIHGMLLQSDGKLVAAGKMYTVAGDYSFAIARLNADGTLDTTFNRSGKVTSNLLGGADIPRSIALDTTSRLVVGGYGYNSSVWNALVVRYLSNGGLDTSFFTTGSRSIPITANDSSILSISVDSNGAIAGAGTAHNGTDFDFAVIRLSSDGVLDTTFNSNGKRIINFKDNDIAYALSDIFESVTDARLTVAGGSTSGSNNRIAAARFLLDGSFDTVFNTTGMTTLPLPPNYSDGIGYAIHNEYNSSLHLNGPKTSLAGKIQVSGDVGNWDLLIARLSTNGILDTTFNSKGYTISLSGASDDAAQALAFRDEDVIVAAGRMKNGSLYNMALARFNTDGTPAQSGKLALGFGGGRFYISGASLTAMVTNQKDSVLVAGETSSQQFYIARYISSGVLDANFNAIGSNVLSDVGGAHAVGLALDQSGRAIVAGYGSGGGTNDIIVARFRTNGVLDTSFNTAGYYISSLGVWTEARAVTIDTDGRACVTGFTSGAGGGQTLISISRFTTDGLYDTSFATYGRAVYNSSKRSIGYWITQHPDGSLVAVGDISGTGGNAARISLITKYQTNGTLDTSFATAGTASFSYAVGESFAYYVAIDSSGRYWLGNNVNSDVAVYKPAPARLLASGQLDTTFNSTGLGQIAAISGMDTTSAWALTQNYKISVAGGRSAGIARYTTDGTLDTTFATAGYIEHMGSISGNPQPNAISLRSGGQVCYTANVGGGVYSSWIFCTWQ